MLHTNCEGTTRRDFLKAGALGTAGFTLAGYLRGIEAGEVAATAPAKAAIFVNLNGGPSHMDTFDLKPNAPEDHRGEFKPIETNVAGIQISEHLPNLAKCMDKFVILRGVSHTLAAHDLGTDYVNCGNRPIRSLDFPSYGSVVTKERPGAPDLPPFVSIPNSRQKPGYLGVQYATMNTGATPKFGQPFSVRGIKLNNGVTVSDVEKRQSLLSDLDKTFKGFEANSQLVEGLDRFSQQAYSVITSPRAREAFDISKESPAFAEKFGKRDFGMSCMLACRLVESGVRFVTVTLGGWDTHADCFNVLKSQRLPTLDEGLAGLFNGLAEKGLLETTAVYVTGEFGRTPKVNPRVGRDHYPRAMFMLLAGGGVKGGRVLGASDEKGTGPEGKGFSPDDVAASYYKMLGIPHTLEYQTNTGRPVMVVRDGQPIPELFA